MEGKRRSFFRFAGLGALVGALGSGIAWKAYGHGGRHGHGAFDPARMEEHLERMLKHFYVEIDATDAQRAQLGPIVKQAAQDLMPLRGRMHEARRQGIELLAAPSVDRAGLERLRSEQIQTADAASQRLARALADVAEVLTPEQRKKLAAHAARMRGRGRPWWG